MRQQIVSFLFIILSFLLASSIARLILHYLEIHNTTTHYITSIVILGVTYGYGKTKFTHYTNKKRTIIVVLLASLTLILLATILLANNY